jgi:hypothetical protein
MDKHNLLKILGFAAVVSTGGPALAASGTDAFAERMVVQLVTPVSSEISQVGDAVQFTVVEPLMDGDRILVGAGSTIEGVVTVARPSGRLGRAGRLGIEIRSADENGTNLPLQIVRPTAEGARGKLGVVRRVAAPFANVGRTMLKLGGSSQAPQQAASLAAADPALAQDLATRSIGAADPLALVELASDSKGSRLAKRGVKAVARVGGAYLNTLVNGPAGALNRGGAVEVPAGALVEVAVQ